MIQLSAILLVGLLVFGHQAVAAEPNRMPVYSALSMAGEPLALHERLGQVMLLNVWATWCEPCRKEMPSLQRLHGKFRAQGLQIVGVNVDAEAPGYRERIADVLQRLGIQYEVLLDPQNRFARTFRAIGVPQTILIDRGGVIVQQWRGGFDPLDEQVVALIERTLKRTP